MNEKWTGHYVYGEGYSDNLYGQTVPFDINWTNDDGSLIGTSTVEVTEKYFNHRPATIQGFIEGSTISFIKQYPCNCTIDEAGNVTLFENQPAAEIHHSGTLIMTILKENGKLQWFTLPKGVPTGIYLYGNMDSL